MYKKNAFIFNALALLPSVVLASAPNLPNTASEVGKVQDKMDNREEVIESSETLSSNQPLLQTPDSVTSPNQDDGVIPNEKGVTEESSDVAPSATLSEDLLDEKAGKEAGCEPTTLGDRYTDNGDGTVLDHRTCLIWLKDTDCLGKQTWDGAKVQICHLNGGKDCEQVQPDKDEHSDEHQCEDYTIGTVTDWRLPTLQELQSVIDYGFFNPVLSDTKGTEKWSKDSKKDAFSSVQLDLYWSATTSALGATHAWHIYLTDGNTGSSEKKRTKNYVWPVRGERQ